MKKIYEKLFELQKEQIKLKKDAENPFFKSSYISLDNILEVYEPLFITKNLLCLHYSKENKLITEIIDLDSEEKVSSEFNIYNNDPQKQGSEITYGKRYNLSQLLNIQTDVDDDGNKASSGGNTKEYYKKEDNETVIWFGNENFEAFQKVKDNYTKDTAVKECRKKYGVSKVWAKKIEELY